MIKIAVMRRYKCGCVGIPVDPQQPNSIMVFHSCGGDDDPPFLRSVDDPGEYTLISPQEAEPLFQAVVALVVDGSSWRDLKKLLKM